MDHEPTHERPPLGGELLDIYGLGHFASEPLIRRDGSTMLREDGEPMTALDYPDHADPAIRGFLSVFVEKHRAGTATQEEYDTMRAVITGYMQLVQNEEGTWVRVSDATRSS